MPETGSETVEALFTIAPPPQMVTTLLGYAETFSLLLRRMNDGSISTATFTIAISALQAEVINSMDVMLLTVEDTAILAGISLMQRHNVNASGAAILATFLRYAQARLAAMVPCILVAADKRLVRAAEAEGLKTLNPELVLAADVPGFLASA